MIRRQWYVVLESAELRSSPIGVLRLGERFLFYRSDEGKAVCLADRCAHRGVALSAGEIKNHDRIMCPFHGLEYDPEGRCRVIPANGRSAPVPPNFRVQSYPVHEEHGFIWIWWGIEAPRDLAPPAFFDDIPDDLTYASVRDPWNAHYSRVIENQLDCVHLPFVHYNSIGRGNRTLVNGPGVEWKTDSKFFMYVYNEVDSGQNPRRPDEVPIPSPNNYKIEFQFPNLWENRIADKVRVLAAFVPVDEGRSLLYLRFYQGLARMPIIRHLVAKMAMPFNSYVAHQDRRVVETQVPKASALKMDENLFQGDRPIVEYRRKRQELMDRGQA